MSTWKRNTLLAFGLVVRGEEAPVPRKDTLEGVGRGREERTGWKVRAKMREEARKRKEGKGEEEVEKPANRQERETIAISASVHDVQRRRETRERETAAITRERAARENA